MYFIKETYSKLGPGLLCAALLGACGGNPVAPGEPAKASSRLSANAHIERLRKEREKTLRSLWNGKSYASLVEAMGPPAVVLDVPGNAAQLTARIFGVLDQPSQCVDTFTVSEETTVSDYFCR